MYLSITVREFIAPRKDPIIYPGKRLPYSYLTDGMNIHQVKFEEGDFKKPMVFFGDMWCDLLEVLEMLGSESLFKKYPILAYGSNASPGQLSYKFKDVTSPIVLVIKGLLMDYDIIYGTNILYGSVPAILINSPGTVVDCWVTFLNEEQLNVMNESEEIGKDYSLGVFKSFQTENNRAIKVYGYVGLMKGYKNKYDDFVALSEIKARNRIFPEKCQMQILREIMFRDMIWQFISRFEINDVMDFPAKLRNDNKFREKINTILNEVYGTKVDIEVPFVRSHDLLKFDKILKCF